MLNTKHIRAAIDAYKRNKDIYDKQFSNSVDYGEAYFCTLREEMR